MIVLSRRGFLKLSAGIGVTLSLQRLAWAEGQEGTPASLPDYRGWEDVYRQRWQWDKVAR
ncbi:MAG: hypothetical protein H6Q33_3604, partial [Deltaproteobacteria bacterium]|nr:hypothetical protein [Deltaproteobacteria bacterium]